MAAFLFFASAAALAADQPATRPTADHMTPGGVKVQDVTSGGGAKAGDQAYVFYTGRLVSNGKVFDSSSNHQPLAPFQFQVGNGDVIKGWDEGVIGMQVGDKRKLTIPAALGYGARGTPDGAIPPNADLEFDIEMVALLRPPPQAAPGK
jgi:FKBP-type peptidyl-prolyl cis-trans isomerase